GAFDVLIGVNLLREGLDLPQVSLVAIMDADKEGFLRSERALTQTAGRAARNINGLVIMYADRSTGSMERTIIETNRRRKKQKSYNKKKGVLPQPLLNKKDSELVRSLNPYKVTTPISKPIIDLSSVEKLQKMVKHTKKEMVKMAKNLNFIEAARLRDKLQQLEEKIKN
ncbi:MAG: helicase-related protein, partial [Flavobacteriales bacterium]|nr:helicase-related protein [Flavobacteriales bacterium]